MERKPEGERSRHYHEAWEAKQIYTDAAAVQRLRAWRVWSVVCPFHPPPLLALVCPCTCIARRMVAAVGGEVT